MKSFYNFLGLQKLMMSVMIFVLLGTSIYAPFHATALSEDQRKLYTQGINQYDLVCGGVAQDDNSLQELIDKLAKENQGQTAISVKSVDGKIAASTNGDQQMATRSTYKVYVAYAILVAVAQNKLSWSSVSGDFNKMIVNSDNDAAERLRNKKEIGGPDGITELLRGELGLSDKTFMGGDGASKYNPDGKNSRSTSDDFAKFLVKLENRKLPGLDKKKDKDQYDSLINAMKNQSARKQGIKEGIGADTEVANKPGWGPAPDAATNDIGIVYADKKYVLAILTDYGDEKWDYIAKIAREVNKNIKESGGSQLPEDNADLSLNGPKQKIELPKKMSLRDKIAQLLIVGIASKDEAKSLAKKYQIGGVMLVNNGSITSKEDIEEIKDAGDIPALIASDEEGGRVQRLKAQTGAYPSAKSLGRESEDEIQKKAQAYGNELNNIGVTVNYAPVADIDDGRNSVISGNDRAFSSDPAKVGEKAGAFAAGMQKAGVVPVFKHFPGHGRADGDSHKENVSTPNISQLKARDLKPYESLLKNGESGVMMGHLVVPGLTQGDKYPQSSINSKAVNLLREDYNFDGVIFTDEIVNMLAIKKEVNNPAKAVSLSIQAGVDMPLFNLDDGSYKRYYSNLDQQIKAIIGQVEQDVKDGKIKEENIDKSLERIIKLKNANFKEGSKKGCECSQGGGNLEGSNNGAKIFNFYVDNEFTPEQAAAFVGNYWQESKWNPAIVNGIGALGIAQWLDRRPALERFAKGKDNPTSSKNPKDLLVQLHFSLFELKGSEGRANSAIRAVKDSGPSAVEKLTLIIRRQYERPGESEANDPARIKKALEMYEKYKSGGGGGASSDTSSVTSGEGCEDGGTGAATGEFAWPLEKKYPITSCYGSKARGRLHTGLDIAAPRGTKIMASDGGTVEMARNSDPGGYGVAVIIKHDNGKWTLYAHMKIATVKKGDKVDQGQKVGEVNDTGSSQGDHLHFNIQKSGGEGQGTEDPLKYLPKDGRGMSGGDCPSSR